MEGVQRHRADRPRHTVWTFVGQTTTMARMRYVVTGGTGFIGRRVVSRILDRAPDAEVWVLVRRESLTRFERLASQGDHPWGDRAKALVGDLTADHLGLSDDTIAELGSVEHMVHCAAIYNITVAEDAQRAANVDGTRAVIALARRLGATLHHVSSIAVAGTYRGEYTEDDFDVAQDLPTPYHQTKFEAELLVRSEPGLRYRIYRPAVVVGDSQTGEMDKVDGPYYFFGILAKLAKLPSFTPVLLPDTGRTNIVPVDYVIDALTELMHAPDRDGLTFHLTAPHSIGLHGIYRGISEAAGLPRLRGSLPRGAATPFLRATGRAKVLRNMAVTQLGIPAEILDVVDLMPTFSAENTREAAGTGITVPEFGSYAPKLWQYWAEHLDPDRARRRRGRTVGRSARHHHRCVQRHRPRLGDRGGPTRRDGFALARNAEALDDLVAEIRAAGGQAHAFTCDVTDGTSVEHTVKDILGRFDHVDYLVNNARPVDPPIGSRVHRLAARLRTGDGGQLLRRRPDGAGPAAALARTPVRPCRQRVERRCSGSQPEVQLVSADQGGAGCLLRCGVDGDAVGPHHVHQHPHAVGAHADDRAVATAQPGAADQRRTRRGNGGARPDQAAPDRYPAGHPGRHRELLHAETVAPCAAPALPRLSRLGRGPRHRTGPTIPRTLAAAAAPGQSDDQTAGTRPGQTCGSAGARRALVADVPTARRLRPTPTGP